MKVSNVGKQVPCLGCVHGTASTAEELVTCERCGFTISVAEHERLLYLGRHNALFGHAYREFYEDQIKDGEIKCAAKLLFAEVWTYIGIAALSGIIGGLSSDAVKLLCRKLVEKYRALNPRAQEIREDPDDDEIESAIEHIRDFLDGLEGVDQDVTKMIRSEIVIDVLAPMLVKYRRNPELLEFKTEEDIRLQLKKTFNLYSQDGSALSQVVEIDRELMRRCFKSVSDD